MTITQIVITLYRNKEGMRLTTQQLFIITGKTWTVGYGRNIYLCV